MVETPRNNSGMSEDRATEIIGFIEKGERIKLGNVTNFDGLKNLAVMAYSALGKKEPDYLDDLVANASTQLAPSRQRVGLDIGSERAQYLVNHLLGREANPKFRKEDDIPKIRELLRKSLATVAKGRENFGDDTTHMFMVKGDQLIEEKYPLIN